jgi:hypothetical protein
MKVKLANPSAISKREPVDAIPGQIMTETGKSVGAVSPFRFLGRSLFVDVALPWLAVRILESYGVPTVWALATAALFPGASTLVSWVYGRRVEAIGIAVFVTILFGIAMALLGDEVRFGLVKAAPAFGLFGIACLASLLAPRPLMFFVARHFQAAGDPAKAAEWNARMELAGFRHAMRVLTLVWGLVCVLEALLGSAVAFLLPVHAAIVAEPAVGISSVVGLLIWTAAYARARQARARPAAP